MHYSYLVTLLLFVFVGCSGNVKDAEKAFGSSNGERCDSANDCDVDQTCKGDFPYERKVCSKECLANDDCGDGVDCVDGISDESDEPLGAAFCLRPCETDSDCPGSECDDRPTGARYCF